MRPDIFMVKIVILILGMGLAFCGITALLCRSARFRQQILPQLGPPGKLIQPFLGSMGLAQLLSCGPHVLALMSLMAYFRPDVKIADEELNQIMEQDEKPSLKGQLAHARMNLREFFRAAIRVNFLYVIPSFGFFMLFTILDILAPLVLRNQAISALWTYYYRRLRNDFADPRWVRDFALDVRPLLLTWFCLVPPIAIVLMLGHFFRTVASHLVSRTEDKHACGQEYLRLSQHIDRSGNSSTVSFYHSPWFNIVVALPFLVGIPGAISAWLYWHLGVDPLLGYPSHEAQFPMVFSKIHMYIFPLGWCLSALFFRSYFTFAWNFTSSEYDIEVYPDSISALPIKGWFLDFLTMRLWHMPLRIKWDEVVSIKWSSGKLPTGTALKDNSLLALMGKLSSIYELMANKLDIHSDFLEIKTESRTMSIRLWEVNSKQKLELFRCLRNYAPSIYLDDKVQQALVGSSVMKEPKYTEIWFSILNSKDETSSGDLELGHSLRNGRYQVKSMLASGGQAVVYLAERDDGETIVLKEFQLTSGESMDAKIESAKPFENESAILSQLSHPSIVKQLDLFYESGRVYLVLEHVEGMTLRELVLTRGTMPLAEVVALAEQMCHILQYLHSQIPPVVHRDFTPENIIIQPDGQLKLIDFSIAEHKAERVHGECAGKHSYTPPEQFRGEAVPASDIYALGATLYFLITGSDPTPITASNLSGYACPAALDKIVRSATALDLSQRYDSVDWLLTDIKAIELNTENMTGPAPQQDSATEPADNAEKDKLAPGDDSQRIKIEAAGDAGIVRLEAANNAETIELEPSDDGEKIKMRTAGDDECILEPAEIRKNA